jgi:hypothetical protein
MEFGGGNCLEAKISLLVGDPFRAVTCDPDNNNISQPKTTK